MSDIRLDIVASDKGASAVLAEFKKHLDQVGSSADLTATKLAQVMAPAAKRAEAAVVATNTALQALAPTAAKATDSCADLLAELDQMGAQARALGNQISGTAAPAIASLGSAAQTATPLLSSAFGTFGMVAFGEVLVGVIQNMDQYTAKLVDWDGSMAKARQRTVESNQEMLVFADRLKESRRELELFGKSVNTQMQLHIQWSEEDFADVKKRFDELLARRAALVGGQGKEGLDFTVGGVSFGGPLAIAGAIMFPELAKGRAPTATNEMDAVSARLSAQAAKVKLAEDAEQRTRDAAQAAADKAEEERIKQVNAEWRVFIANQEKVAAQYEKLTKEAAKYFDENAKMQDRIDREGRAGLIRSTGQQIKGMTTGPLSPAGDMKIQAEALLKIQEQGRKFETSELLKELGLRAKLLDGEIGRTQQQRERIAIEKIELLFAAQAEQDRIRFMEEQIRLTKELGKISNEALRDAALITIDQSRAAYEELAGTRARDQAAEIAKVHAVEYNKMLDSIREGAGSIFDAMLTKGKSVFSSLADFFLGVFNTAARKIFQNVAEMVFSRGQSGVGILSGVFPGLSGGGFGGSGASTAINGVSYPAWTGASSFAASGAGSGASVINGVTYPAWTGAGSAKASSGLAGSTAGALTSAGLVMGGSLLLGDAWKQGGTRGIVEGIGGGAAAGAGIGMSIGTAIFPGVGTAVGAAVGAIGGALVGLVTGIFGGGEKARERERQRRADVQAGLAFEGSSGTNLFASFGEGLGSEIETDSTGRLRSLPRIGGDTYNVNVSLVDGRHAEEAATLFINRVRRETLQGGLTDDIAYASR